MSYRNLVKHLEAYGFQINPYDPFKSNKVVNEKYMTVVWHVDYLMVSHMGSFEIRKISWLLVHHLWGTYFPQSK